MTSPSAALALLLAALALPAAARADESAAAPPARQPAGSDQEALQRELEKALQQDAATNKPPASSAPAAPASQPEQPQSAPPQQTATRGTQSFNPDLSVIGDFALAAFRNPRPMELGGHDPSENGFNLQALEISLGAAVDPYFRFDVNLAFGREHSFEIEEAYATTLALPANLQMRAGQFLTRFGRINPMHPHVWEFVDQPLVIGKLLGPDGNRAPGFEVSQLLSFVPWYTELVVSANQATGGGARSFLGAEPPRPPNSVLDVQYLAALKQFWAPTDDLSIAWGLSALAGPYAFGPDARTEIYGTDLYVKYRPIGEASATIVSFTTEALVRRRHGMEGVPKTALTDGGFYSQLFWRFAQRWATGLRGEYVTGESEDPTDPGWTRARWRASAALTFWPSEFSRLRLQANYDRALDESSANPSVFLAFEFSGGAHGAHAF